MEDEDDHDKKNKRKKQDPVTEVCTRKDKLNDKSAEKTKKQRLTDQP